MGLVGGESCSSGILYIVHILPNRLCDGLLLHLSHALFIFLFFHFYLRHNASAINGAHQIVHLVNHNHGIIKQGLAQ